jgi:5-methylcytosine-specific restriction endonuclease McrA
VKYRHLYRTQAWRKLSKAILARDGYRCATAGCPNVATSADHFPVGAWEAFASGSPELFWDVSNLVARCRSCNSRLGVRRRNARYRGVPRRRRVEAIGAERAAREWADQYERDQDQLTRERQEPERAPRLPAIY